MKEKDHTVWIHCKIIMKEIGPITQTGHIVEIGYEATTTKMTIEMPMRRNIVGI